MIMTIGSQARGDTGLKIWMNGLTAVFTTLLSPHRMPSGTAIRDAMTNPVNTVFRLVKI